MSFVHIPSINYYGSTVSPCANVALAHCLPLQKTIESLSDVISVTCTQRQRHTP
ncbi:hypothetical protein HBI56_039100 [Parastagonospora nodorum]|uniref:Uncharacterized protein n=1 Tax=Phaeosphaeria nodorum (strain SN15 / ATCC MYA-4574 / FGSC 10173) TaxID=321614 RepID=A0A7U2HWQ6_PHANO|nr:hypothetical protein HBH56_067690 [Parastagonospora nodorum]QRC93448.1 hypothetical protein JI435_403830 [Parastagonospora nodorum SN15]KAH3932520.1 hypothetical protein HBH54_080420 [Parastagonospora nodorum]KAH3954966.1 hypothetical protein HBH53_013990 [Parastagonospora nodorum]KAH3986141.1 hypothetical protein HBH52_045170 [Parastagonospora nodorum]